MFNRFIYPGPTKVLPVRLCSCQPGVDPLSDNRPLELGEHPAHLENGLASWCGGVQALLMQILVDTQAERPHDKMLVIVIKVERFCSTGIIAICYPRLFPILGTLLFRTQPFEF